MSNSSRWLDRVPVPLALAVVLSVPFVLLFLSLRRLPYLSVVAVGRQLLAVLVAAVLTLATFVGGFYLYFKGRESPPVRWYERWRAARWQRQYQEQLLQKWNRAPLLTSTPIETGALKLSFQPSFHPPSTVDIRSNEGGGTVVLEVNGTTQQSAVPAESAHRLFRRLSELHRVPSSPNEPVLDGCVVNLQFTSDDGRQIFAGSGFPLTAMQPTEYAITRAAMDLLEQVDWSPTQREYIDQLAGYFSHDPAP